MSRLAIFIKTLLRERTLVKCVQSIERYAGVDYRLYIADDGPISAVKRALYDRLSSEGHVVVELPEPTGASGSRNLLLERLGDERAVLRMDDDFCLAQETSLTAMMDVLSHDSRVGAVADLERQIGDGKGVKSGEVRDHQGFIDLSFRRARLRRVPMHTFSYQVTNNGTRYAFCEYTRNMLMIRRKVFDTVRWEPRLQFTGEHLDFLLQIKLSPWSVAFTPDSTHWHREDLFEPAYEAYAKELKKLTSASRDEAERVYLEKWGVSSPGGGKLFRRAKSLGLAMLGRFK